MNVIFFSYCKARKNALLTHVQEGYEKEWWVTPTQSSSNKTRNSNRKYGAGDWILFILRGLLHGLLDTFSGDIF